jgi:hypothetical protein
MIRFIVILLTLRFGGGSSHHLDSDSCTRYEIIDEYTLSTDLKDRAWPVLKGA